MLIAWATPFNIRSAIGLFSRFVCDELHARGHQIEIIRTESGPELAMEALPCDFPLVDVAKCDVDRYDVIVVNVGNHAPYHAQMLTLFARRSPLSIFHDIEMRHFEWGLQHRHNLSLPRLAGSDHEVADWEGDMVDPAARPLLGALAAMSCGAIIHGPHYRATVSTYCPGPVEMIPLCFPDTGKRRASRKLKPGRRIGVFGMINDHKQPRRVLEAMALIAPEVGEIELHLAGDCETHYREMLEGMAADLGLMKPVFHGYIPDDRLQDILEDCHAICCLRYPVTEGSSASLVTALYRGRPLVISDIASFSLVPDDVSYKVSYGDDPVDLAGALRTIFDDPRQAMEKAARATKWARKGFSAQGYADSLEPVLISAQEKSTLMSVARMLPAALTTPDHEPMIGAVEKFAEVLDWMEASQK